MKKYLLVLFFYSSPLLADQYDTPVDKTLSTSPSKNEIKQSRIDNAPSKNRVWSLELATIRYTQNVNPGHSLNGTGGRISIGYGLIGLKHLLLGDFSLYFGPFGENYKTASFDYTGSGASITVGHGFNAIRGDDMGVGLLGGFSYQDFYGRFYGRNDADKPVPANSEGIVTGYGNTLSSADLNFGIFLSWFKSQRPDTHDIEALTTRNEGLIWSLQASLPIWSRFRARFKALDAGGGESDKVQKGTLEGTKFILSLRAFLGT